MAEPQVVYDVIHRKTDKVIRKEITDREYAEHVAQQMNKDENTDQYYSQGYIKAKGF